MFEILTLTGALVYVLLLAAFFYWLFLGRAKQPKYNLEQIAARLSGSLCGTSWHREHREIDWEFASDGTGVRYGEETRFFLWRQISQGTVAIAFTHASSDYLGRRHLEDGDPTFTWENELTWIRVEYKVRVGNSGILLTGLLESPELSFCYSGIGIDEYL